MSLAGRLWRKGKTLLGLSPRMVVLAFVSLGLTAAIRLALWVIPFRVTRRIADAVGPNRFVKDHVTAQQIAWLVHVGSRNVYKATCLTQALTARILLNGAGMANKLHIGVMRSDRFESHAWIECEGRVLVGGAEQSSQFATILTIKSRDAMHISGNE